MTRLLDAAIAAHPLVWREKYSAVVRGTLMDVADDRGGRVPASETLPLLLRGLWMRARGSVAFWGGLIIIAIQLAAAVRGQVYFGLDGSLTSVALSLSLGLTYSLLVVALVAGWDGARARVEGIPSASSRLHRLASNSLPVVVAATVGYLAAIGVVMAHVGAPWVTMPGVLVVLSQAAMVLASIAVGQALGALLPRVVVIFAAPMAVAIVGVVLFRWLTSWLGVAWNFYPGIAYEVDTLPIVLQLIGSALVAVLAVGVVAVPSILLRAAAVVAISAVVAVGAAIGGNTVAMAEPVPRAESELVCSTAEPVVCLWPEQEAAFGAQYRADMGDVYERAVAVGLPIHGPAPRSVTQFGLTGIRAVEGISGTDPAEYGLGISGLRPGDMTELYAASMTVGFFVEPVDGMGEAMLLQHSIAVVLGVLPGDTWMVKPDPFTGQTFIDRADAPDEAESLALVERWLAEGVDGVRSPSA